MPNRQLIPIILAASIVLGAPACRPSQTGSNETQPPATVPAPETPPAQPTALFLQGGELYEQHCAQCHLAGQGSPVVPPLIGAPGVTESASRTIRAVIKGVSGPLVVNGVTYNGIMPAMDWLEDAEVAAVVTYVRTEFGKQSGDVAVEQVAAER